MLLKPIKTEADHRAALERLSSLMDAQPNTPQGDELAVLSMLIDAYERQHYPLPPADPIEAIKFRMDQSNLTKKDLVPYLGDPKKVSEILNGKRPLTLKMIRALHNGLGIPAESLIAERHINPVTARMKRMREKKTA